MIYSVDLAHYGVSRAKDCWELWYNYKFHTVVIKNEIAMSETNQIWSVQLSTQRQADLTYNVAEF